jgi:cytochrome oxidase Cu insertion factor (SCO1/SenC/PrrC family)
MRMAAEHDGGAYDVMHSPRSFLIDPAGSVRRMYAPDVAPGTIAADIRRVLAGG